MTQFNRLWSQEKIMEQFFQLSAALRTDPKTAPLAPQADDVLAALEALAGEQKLTRREQINAQCQVNAADRRLDIALSMLSGAARTAERSDPSLRVVAVLFPEGLSGITRFSGRGVETEVALSRRLLAILPGLPGAELLQDAAARVGAAADEADGFLAQLKDLDARLDQLRTRQDELVGRAYTTFHSIRADLVKIFNNNQGYISSFFLI